MRAHKALNRRLPTATMNAGVFHRAISCTSPASNRPGNDHKQGAAMPPFIYLSPQYARNPTDRVSVITCLLDARWL
jgi:hypothetical protein